MLAHEILREAATIIEAGGWSQAVHARDATGRAVGLYNTSGGTSRAAVNPAAVSFSIYGAIVKAASQGGPGVNLSAVWPTIHELARAKNEVRAGGNNHLHAVMAFNEAVGRTKDEVLAFLLEAADEIAPKPALCPNGLEHGACLFPKCVSLCPGRVQAPASTETAGG